MNSHQDFEDEELMPGYIKDPKKIRIIRGCCLLICVLPYALMVFGSSSIDDFIGKYKFFTIWGMTFTLIANILAQF